MLQGNAGGHFKLWELRVKAASSGKDLATALAEDLVDNRVGEKDLSMIISALGDNHARENQECPTAKEAWNKLQHRYAGKSMMNKLALLDNVLNNRFGQVFNMGDHIAMTESQFFCLPYTGTTME